MLARLATKQPATNRRLAKERAAPWRKENRQLAKPKAKAAVPTVERMGRKAKVGKKEKARRLPKYGRLLFASFQRVSAFDDGGITRRFFACTADREMVS